jgi:iron(III) transport system substrate-binding protein
MQSDRSDVRVGRRTLLKAALSLGAFQLVDTFGVPATSRAEPSDQSNIAAYTGADRTQRLIEGAKKEGGLTIYTSATVPDMTALTDAFQKKYGIKPVIWRGSSEDVVQRGVTEARGGRHDVDVFETNGPEMEELQRENVLQKLVSPVQADLAPDAITPSRQWIGDRMQLWVAAYNTSRVKGSDLPKSYEDLLDPKWKGKLGIEAGDIDWFQSTISGLGEQMGEQKALDLFRQIIAKNGISVRKGHTLLTNLVVAGEVPLALTVYGYKAKQLKAEGAPLDWFVIPPQIGRFQGVGVSRHPPHPYTAVLFADWLLSEDGQRVLVTRDMLPANIKVKPLPNLPLRFVDPAKFLDEHQRWENLYQEIVVDRAS